MYSPKQLTIRTALLQAPDDALQPLLGVFIRDLNVNWNPTINPTIADNAWRHYAPSSEQAINLRLEGVVNAEPASQYIRKAGIEGVLIRLEITWPGTTISDGNYYIRTYQEYGEPDNVLEYRAELASADVQTFTAVS